MLDLALRRLLLNRHDGLGCGVGGIVRLVRNRLAQVRVLRLAAAAYAAHGWAVLPGAYAVDGRCECQRADCTRIGIHPLVEQWARAATTDILQIARWWARDAWAILLPTSPRVEVIEVPATLGRPTIKVLGDRVGPVAVMSDKRWLLFCAADPEVDVVTTDEEWRSRLTFHTSGSWVPVPPSGGAPDQLGWLRPPQLVGWRLPPTQDVLAAARAVPRQLSVPSTVPLSR